MKATSVPLLSTNSGLTLESRGYSRPALRPIEEVVLSKLAQENMIELATAKPSHERRFTGLDLTVTELIALAPGIREWGINE